MPRPNVIHSGDERFQDEWSVEAEIYLQGHQTHHEVDNVILRLVQHDYWKIAEYTVFDIGYNFASSYYFFRCHKCVSSTISSYNLHTLPTGRWIKFKFEAVRIVTNFNFQTTYLGTEYYDQSNYHLKFYMDDSLVVQLQLDEKQFGHTVNWPFYSLDAGPFAPPKRHIMFGHYEHDNGRIPLVANVRVQGTRPQTCNECSHNDENNCDFDTWATTCTDRNDYFIDGGATCGCRDNYIGDGTAAQPCRYCSTTHNCMRQRSGCGGYGPVTFNINSLTSCLSSARKGLKF